MSHSTSLVVRSNAASTAAKIVVLGSVVVCGAYFLDRRARRVTLSSNLGAIECDDIPLEGPVADSVPAKNEVELVTVLRSKEDDSPKGAVKVLGEEERVREEDSAEKEEEQKEEAQKEEAHAADSELIPEPQLEPVQLLVIGLKTSRFEVLQLELNPRKKCVGDILAQVAVTATEPLLRTQQYDGICLLDGAGFGPGEMLEDCFHGQDRFAIAIPSGSTGLQMKKHARSIMKDPQLTGLFNNIVDISFLEDTSGSEKVYSEKDESGADNIPHTKDKSGADNIPHTVSVNVSEPTIGSPSSIPEMKRRETLSTKEGSSDDSKSQGSSGSDYKKVSEEDLAAQDGNPTPSGNKPKSMKALIRRSGSLTNMAKMAKKIPKRASKRLSRG